MGRLIEGFWICKYCNTKVRGGLRECPKCGKARDENTRFDLDIGKLNYVPEEEAIHINRKPDWVCNYCNQLNSADDLTCASCGASRTKDNLDYFENKKKQEEDELESNFSSNIDYSTTRNSFWTMLLDFFSSNIQIILISIVSLFMLCGLIYLISPKEQEITIQEFSWQRCIDIQRYQTVEESDWSLPSDARLQFSRKEFSHYEKVLDHYETKTREVAKEHLIGYEEYVSGYRDLGNGYFEEITSSKPIYETYYETETYNEPVYRDEAVYRTKYYYEIDKWLYERSVKTSGNDKEPYWGEVILDSDERVYYEGESFFIMGLNKKEETKTISLSYEDWDSLELGQTVKLKVSLGHGKIVE